MGATNVFVWKATVLKRLLAFISDYRKVFKGVSDDSVPPETRINELIDCLSDFNLLSGMQITHPDKNHILFSMKYLNEEFSEDIFPCTKPKEAVKNAIDFLLEDRKEMCLNTFQKIDKMARFLSILIIIRLAKNNLNCCTLEQTLSSEEQMIDNRDRNISLTGSIKEAVTKFKLWLLYQPNMPTPPEWHRHYPHTVKLSLFPEPDQNYRCDHENGLKKPFQWLIEQNWKIVSMNPENEKPYSKGEATFGLLSSLKLITSEMLNINSILYYKKIEEQLIETAMNQYLYGYLMSKSEERAAALLKENCTIYCYTYDDVKQTRFTFSFSPPITWIIHDMECALSAAAAIDDVPVQDHRVLLRYLADTVKEKRTVHYTISLDNELYRLLAYEVFQPNTIRLEKNEQSTEHKEYIALVKRMIHALTVCNVLKIVYLAKKKYLLFRFKDQRICCESMMLAHQFTWDMSTFSITDNVLGYDLSGDSDAYDFNHLQFHFSRQVVKAIVFLNYLDDEKRNIALNKLIEIAQNFTVQSRKAQVKAIFVLSYFLYDSAGTNYAMRQKIYKATYGTSIYPFMVKLAQNLIIPKGKDSFFVSTIVNTIKRSCKMEDGHALSDPFFLFYGCYVSEFLEAKISPFLLQAMNIQRKIWDEYLNGQNADNIHYYQKICSLLSDALEQLQAYALKPTSDIAKYVYGANLLLFCAADMHNFFHCSDSFLEYIKGNNLKEMLLTCCIYCDYYTRKLSVYSQGEQYVDNKTTYLLCGAFRLVCAFHIELAERLSCLSTEMVNDYAIFYQNEKQCRYRALLYRLLSYTDASPIIFHLSEEERMKWKDTFLPYDHIPDAETFISNPRTLQICE